MFVSWKGTNCKQTLLPIIGKVLFIQFTMICFMHPVNNFSSNALALNRAAILIKKRNLFVEYTKEFNIIQDLNKKISTNPEKNKEI